jgi:predicted DsbA family dithiol-disulfide isomerase
MPEEYKARIMAGRPRLDAIAREQYGLELNQGPFGISSRLALIGAKVAESEGHGPAYHAALMRAYWLDARNIGQPDVLADVAASIGMEREAFLAALDEPEFEEAVEADVEQARSFGIHAVPALVFAEKYLVSGAQPYPVLTQVVEQVQEREGQT